LTYCKALASFTGLRHNGATARLWCGRWIVLLLIQVGFAQVWRTNVVRFEVCCMITVRGDPWLPCSASRKEIHITERLNHVQSRTLYFQAKASAG